jgi:hypothetical protein
VVHRPQCAPDPAPRRSRGPVGEGELRYQLERKDHHPLAQADELRDVLGDLEQQGLVEAELCFGLTAEGRVRLAALDAGGEGGS